MMPTPAPGWFPDPSAPSAMRWWDGNAWTEHTTPLAADTTTPTAPQPTVIEPSEAAPATPLSPTMRRALIIAAVILVIGLTAAFAPTLLVVVGIVLFGIALFVVIKGSAPRLKIQSRLAGLGAMGLAFALFMTGGLSGAAQSSSPSASLQSEASKPQAFVDAPSAPATPTPVPTTFEEIQESAPVAFERMSIDSDQYDVGTSTVTTAGVDGTKVTTIRITYVDGVEHAREVASEAVTVAPVTEITAIGTRQPAPPPPPAPAAPVPFAAPAPAQGDCHPSYAGVCVPKASDVDCAGGSGDGPEYASGPLQVVGDDVYDLDRDGDGIACD